MHVIEEFDCIIDNSDSITSVENFIGKSKAHAYFINHGAHGYAKFVLDEQTVMALESGLYKLQNSLDRKHIYNMLFDMTISNQMPGSLVLHIILKNLTASNESEDVLTEVLSSIVPKIIRKYISVDEKDMYYDEFF